MMPILETVRLLVRPFTMTDLEDVYRLLDVDLAEAQLHTEKTPSLAERAKWLQWAVLNYEQLAKLRQPPYGDRAVVSRSTGELIGACGYVPCLNAFEQLPSFASGERHSDPGLYSTEFGLFYAIFPSHQRQGYATEAARALADYAFKNLRVRRLVATTDYDNTASINVMRKLGMRVEKNPQSEPPWLQVVGLLENEP